MRVAIAGGTGFVGKTLTEQLLKDGHEVLILTRRIKEAANHEQLFFLQWLPEGEDTIKQLENLDAFINLAGESLNSGRWTEKRKHIILNSRLETTSAVISIIKQLKNKPRVLVNASAIGIYGTSLTETFTEETNLTGSDFLAETVRLWETQALTAEELEIRTVLCRFGLILDKQLGALPKIALPYKLFIGGNVGSGDQWVSWISIEDVVQGILFTIENEGLNGPINMTAPSPVRMKEFGQTLGTILHRPHWIPVPGAALRIILGEMSILVLEGQKVLPNVLLQAGYRFKYSDLYSALKNIYQK
ncbi:TIGR01777 family oxidoreductase [Bacillus dakarensis]|uniref:TIGR01777 family oxidoreductase n=1 Tax=Robertmurraya dakarensis TaxID=1926278 RepID=UPI000980F096|nr:TIGR01777 family oxidoreductase [Bacillus dakarensis]